MSYLFNESKKIKDEDRLKMAKLYFLSNFFVGETNNNRGRCGSY